MTLPTLECKRCGYEWHPRKEKVRCCPQCKSPYWDVEKQQYYGRDIEKYNISTDDTRSFTVVASSMRTVIREVREWLIEEGRSGEIKVEITPVLKGGDELTPKIMRIRIPVGRHPDDEYIQ